MRGVSRPVLRLAWREIIRHRWRSLLVTVLIGLPILASVSAVTLIETGSISDDEARPFTYGTAQAQVYYGYIETDPEIDTSSPKSVNAAAQEMRSITGLTVVPSIWGSTWVTAGGQSWPSAQLSTDFTSPLTDGLGQVVSGRLPRSASEVAISPHLRHRGLAIGDQITVGATSMRVVGVARSIAYGSSVPEDAVLTFNTGSDAPLTAGVDLAFLVGAPGEPHLSAALIQRLAVDGIEVLPRDLEDDEYLGSGDRELIALLVTCLLIEIVLLAGPAFAVGVRRQQHSLALVAIAGGNPRTIRRIVLIQGLILGLGASVMGSALSIPLMWLSLQALETWFGITLGPFDIGTVAIAPAIILGTLSALAAALIPARQAAKASVITSLAGRQSTPRVRALWPVLGAFILLTGTAGSLTSAHSLSGGMANGWLAIVSVCGAVLMTPWLISVVARWAHRFPLPLRLAFRDADRHRSRSAPAVAAVMASIAAVVALGIGSGSDARANDLARYYPYPIGSATLSAQTSEQLDALIPVVKERTGITFTPLSTLDSVFVLTQDLGDRQYDSTVMVAEAADLKSWGIELPADAVDALANGKALIDTSLSQSGPLKWEDWSEDEITTPRSFPQSHPTDLTLPGRVPDGAAQPVIASAVITPQTAARYQFDHRSRAESALAIGPLNAAEATEIRQAATSVTPINWSLDVTHQQRSDYWLILLLLTGLGTFTVLLGTFSATGLALNDARRDLDTLSAVGARPLSRRLVAGSHAFAIAFLGVALGILVGFTPGATAAYLLTVNGMDDGWTLTVPWPLLAILLVGLPLVAGLTTALVSRTRITRRTT